LKRVFHESKVKKQEDEIPDICHTLGRGKQREKEGPFGAWWRACLRREPFHRIPSRVRLRLRNRGAWPPQLRTRYTESSC